MQSNKTKTSHRYWVLQLTFWSGYWLLNLLFMQAWGASVSSVMSGIFFCLSLMMLLTTHGLRLIYKRIQHQLSLLRISLHLIWILPLTSILIQLILAGLIVMVISSNPDINRGLQAGSAGSIIGYSINTCIMLIMWCLVYLLRAELINRRQTEQEYWKNQIKLRDIELQFLRSQINSHFLFNAINNIRSLILEDVQASRQALSDLATLLRGLMQSDGKMTVNLRDEIEWVKGYLSLEKLQFENRFHYELKIEPELMDAQIPPLLLQTLVENSIKHGIAARRNGGTIEIQAIRISTHHWRLQVENPLAELPDRHQGNAIGLKNARERLQAAFAENAKLELTITNTALATVEMPL